MISPQTIRSTAWRRSSRSWALRFFPVARRAVVSTPLFDPAAEVAAADLVKGALKDGNDVTIRAMRPDDKQRLVKAFHHLQPQTIRTRFFYPKKTLSEDDLRWLDEISRGNHMGLAATVTEGCEELVVGEGSYVVLGRSAEIGFTVADAWQGGGIASRLLRHLARIARDRGVGEFEAYVLPDNEPMLTVFRRSGLPMTIRYAEGVLHVTLALDSSSISR